MDKITHAAILAFLNRKKRFNLNSNSNQPSDADRSRGWKNIQRLLPKILDYGRAEGILQSAREGVCPCLVYLYVCLRDSECHHECSNFIQNLPGFIQVVQEEAQHVKEQRSGDKVHLPTNVCSITNKSLH